MNRYATYKDSGIPWLGEVPEHWEIKHSNQIFKIHNGATPKTSEPDYWGDEIAWFTPKDLGDNKNKEIAVSLKMITKEGYENCGVSLAPAKSIALSKRAPIGHLAITLLPAVVNQGCFLLEVLSPNDVNYLYYWLHANKSTLNSFGQGSTFMELPREKFAMLKISIPSEKEQTAIAHYLDTKLGEIDALIGKQQTLLEKLAEQRTAVITHAVTKGLNPAAPMKNSGVEWLGDVPTHWQLINLKFLCRVKGGYAFSSDNFSDEGIPVIRISDILFDGTVDNINCKRIPLELAPNQKDFELRNGQLVMAMTGATIGKISKYCSEDYAYINQRVGKFEAFNSRLNYAFLYHLLNTSGYQEHIKLTAFGGAQPNISDSEMVNYQMVLPTMEEQAHIADYLDKETAKIDRLCDTVNQTIDRLKEYRIALITQAVTGKVKVTNE